MKGDDKETDVKRLEIFFIFFKVGQIIFLSFWLYIPSSPQSSNNIISFRYCDGVRAMIDSSVLNSAERASLWKTIITETWDLFRPIL